MKVAIVYHFFATYRRPILEYLDTHEDDSYIFYGDSVNRLMPGVPVWRPKDGGDFVEAKGTRLPGGFLLQRKVISLAFNKDIETIIFLGDWHFLTTWISAVLARLRGKTVLYWTHGWRDSDRGIKMFIRKIFYRIPHGLVLYGNIGREIGITQGFADDNIYTIYNSLDYETQKSIRESVTPEELKMLRHELFESPENPMLILVGRISRSKRIDLLLEAAAKLKQLKKPVNILIVGDGEDRENLKELAQSLDLPVNFYGSCHDEEIVGRLLMCAQLTICPAAAGLTVIHSMMYGVPVVTSDRTSFHGPEVEAVVPDFSGAIFKNGDAEDLATKIAKLLEQDLELMRARCMAIVDRFYNPRIQASEIRRAIRQQEPTRSKMSDAFTD